MQNATETSATRPSGRQLLDELQEVEELSESAVHYFLGALANRLSGSTQGVADWRAAFSTARACVADEQERRR